MFQYFRTSKIPVVAADMVAWFSRAMTKEQIKRARDFGPEIVMFLKRMRDRGQYSLHPSTMSELEGYLDAILSPDPGITAACPDDREAGPDCYL